MLQVLLVKTVVSVKIKQKKLYQSIGKQTTKDIFIIL